MDPFYQKQLFGTSAADGGAPRVIRRVTGEKRTGASSTSFAPLPKPQVPCVGHAFERRAFGMWMNLVLGYAKHPLRPSRLNLVMRRGVTDRGTKALPADAKHGLKAHLKEAYFQEKAKSSKRLKTSTLQGQTTSVPSITPQRGARKGKKSQKSKPANDVPTIQDWNAIPPFVCVVAGPTGCGKSTLVQTCMGSATVHELDTGMASCKERVTSVLSQRTKPDFILIDPWDAITKKAELTEVLTKHAPASQCGIVLVVNDSPKMMKHLKTMLGSRNTYIIRMKTLDREERKTVLTKHVVAFRKAHPNKELYLTTRDMESLAENENVQHAVRMLEFRLITDRGVQQWRQARASASFKASHIPEPRSSYDIACDISRRIPAMIAKGHEMPKLPEALANELLSSTEHRFIRDILGQAAKRAPGLTLDGAFSVAEALSWSDLFPVENRDAFPLDDEGKLWDLTFWPAIAAAATRHGNSHRESGALKKNRTPMSDWDLTATKPGQSFNPLSTLRARQKALHSDKTPVLGEAAATYSQAPLDALHYRGSALFRGNHFYEAPELLRPEWYKGMTSRYQDYLSDLTKIQSTLKLPGATATPVNIEDCGFAFVDPKNPRGKLSEKQPDKIVPIPRPDLPSRERLFAYPS